MVTRVNCKTTYGEWSFGIFFSKFFNNIKINELLYSINDIKIYRSTIFNNIDFLYNELVNNFSKFDFNVNFSHIYF